MLYERLDFHCHYKAKMRRKAEIVLVSKERRLHFMILHVMERVTLNCWTNNCFGQTAGLEISVRLP